MRSLSTLLPLITLLLVAYLVLVVGAPRPLVSLRLLGGPTDKLAHFSGTLEAESDGRPLANVPLELLAQSSAGGNATSRVVLDGEGRAEVSLDFRAAPIEFDLRVHRSGSELASSRVEMTRERWLARAQRRGGFFAANKQGALNLAIAPARGVFAVPFAGPLLIRVQAGGAPVADANVHVDADGARVTPAEGMSNARGLVRIELTPSEHVVTVQLRATKGELSGATSLSVPVAPGAMEAVRTPAGLRIRSPIPRESAFVTLLNEDGRLRAERVLLSARGDGAESSDIALTSLPEGPLWARVENEPGGAGAAVVGWPLFESEDSPARTLDVRDVVLLDSSAAALGQERARRRGVLGWALVVGLMGALGSILIVLGRARSSGRSLEAHLDHELGADASLRLAPRPRTRSLVFTALIALGFLALAALFAWRLGT